MLPKPGSRIITTMPYAPNTLLINRLTADRLAELTDDAAQSEIQWTVVDQARVEADELVDGYCRGRYEVPFSDPVPGIIQSSAADITAYLLYQRRMGTDMPESVVNSRANAIKTLEAIQRGHIQLGVAMPEEPGQATIAGNSKPEDKQFPKTIWNRLP